MSLTFISAGAGSGKTYTLTQTLGGLLKSSKIRPSGVIATTFTKKAATELRERVRQFLLENGEFASASAMGQARIGTVNSVCGAMLTRFSFEAGMPTEQKVLEDAQATMLIREAIDAALTAEEVSQLSEIAYRLGIDDWAGALRELVTQCRANDIPSESLASFAQKNADDLLQHFPKPGQRDLSNELGKLIDQALPVLRTSAETSSVKKTKDYLTTLETFARRLNSGAAQWSDWVGLGKSSPEKGLTNLSEPIQLIAQQVASHRQLHQDLRSYLQMMFLLAGKALEHYRIRKLELGVVDFTDQEHLLLKLLDHPEVASVLRHELDLLLVDEFQDTSPIQLALFLKLSKLARETYWVGDLKQAIYGFRGSDTALMKAVLASLNVLGGKKAILDRSWRSRPALVNLVNSVFTKAFEDSLPKEEVELKPERVETPNLPAFVDWRLGGANVAEISMALASGIKSLLDGKGEIPDPTTKALRPIRPKDIAVLCRTHDTIAQVATCLRAIGIPVATSRPGLLATPEATLAIACLRRLNDSNDTIATAEILSLADSTEPEVWLSERLAYLAAGESKTLWRETGNSKHPVLGCIAELRDALPVLAPREALQRVITETHLERIVLAWRQDPAVAQVRLANLEALIHLADEYENTCRGARQAASISGLLLWLGEQAGAGLDAQAEPALDAVRLLTHHAAKGLEWPVVILNDLEKNVRNRLWGITARSLNDIDATKPLADRFIRYWPWPFGKHSSGIEVLDAISRTEVAGVFQKEAEDEARRLLYVSMTRPREMLVFARKKKAKAAPWLETLSADWLEHFDSERGVLDLPGNRGAIPAEMLEIDASVDTSARLDTKRCVSWFPVLPEQEFLPRDLNPSAAAAGNAGLLERLTVGGRLSVLDGVDWGALGSAIHGAIALYFTAKRKLRTEEVDRILSNFGVQTYISAEGVVGQIDALDKWINARWPRNNPRSEVPVCAVLGNGQVMQGRIDLLLETDDGYILIDHKSSPLSFDKWETLAEVYGAQLTAYARAIDLCSDKKVVEKWLFLPVAGGALRVE